VRDRIDQASTLLLNIEALAHSVNISAEYLSRQSRLTYGESPDSLVPYLQAVSPAALGASTGSGTQRGCG
jgi:hypothetical protein